MSQNKQRQRVKLEPRLESVIQIKQPMVRDFSTGGGHGPGQPGQTPQGETSPTTS